MHGWWYKDETEDFIGPFEDEEDAKRSRRIQAAFLNQKKPEPVSLGDMLEPNEGRIVVLVDSKSEFTPQGLYIPEETARSIHEEKATQGKVVAKAEDCEFVEVGDVVVFGKYTGTKIKWQPPREEGQPAKERQTVIIMNENSVLAKLLTPEQAANLKVKG